MATDYPAGVYDLYMKYLNEMEQEGIASDIDSYIPQLPYIYPQGDGGQDDPPDRSWDKEYDTEDFEALALKDEYGNVKYGLSEEEQALMDRITGKGGFNLKTDYPMFGYALGLPFGAFGTAYNRRKDKKKAEQELKDLVEKREQEKAMTEVNANIAQYGTTGGVGSDRPNVGINEPGGGKGQSPTGGDVMGTPFDKGGRVGYANGLGVYPILDVTQRGSELGSGITLNERDITYGGTVLGQGDNWYGGIEGLTGNVNVDVQKGDDTLFEETFSKDDQINYLLGHGDPEGDRWQLKLDEGLDNAMLSYRGTFAEGGLVDLLNRR